MMQNEWISVKDRLPKIQERVILSGNKGTIFVGHRDKPTLIWRVSGEGWVYDPEEYTDDIDSLEKAEDCAFNDETEHISQLSITSVNYEDRFEGVAAWMPLPEPYEEGGRK